MCTAWKRRTETNLSSISKFASFLEFTGCEGDCRLGTLADPRLWVSTLPCKPFPRSAGIIQMSGREVSAFKQVLGRVRRLVLFQQAFQPM